MTSPFEGFEHAVCSAVPLATATSFHIGGPAEYFIEPQSVEELVALLERCANERIHVRVLGSGSNVLVADRGVSGAVLRLSKLRRIVRSGPHVTCGAGVPIPALIRQAERWGLSGIEALAGIPGTVGGAIAMNAGGKHGCIASVLCSVTTVDRYGLLRERPGATLNPGYRQMQLRGEIVVEATLQLTEKTRAEIAEARKRILSEKARTQPLTAWSAGCVFRNPVRTSDGALSQLPAGKLIDLAKMKGRRVGGAVVSHKHANFIINEGSATARDVQTLIRDIRRCVRKTFGIHLKLEIEVWNQ